LAPRHPAAGSFFLDEASRACGAPIEIQLESTEAFVRVLMGNEYKIKFPVPANFDPARLFQQLPSPIERGAMKEIYNYAVEADGFYFVDRGVNPKISAIAFRCFIDEALRATGSVEIQVR
jgi:hypothetical protein